MIGFSLGAHVSGFTGQELEGNVSRITGEVTHITGMARQLGNISSLTGDVTRSQLSLSRTYHRMF